MSFLSFLDSFSINTYCSLRVKVELSVQCVCVSGQGEMIKCVDEGDMGVHSGREGVAKARNATCCVRLRLCVVNAEKVQCVCAVKVG